MSAEGDYLFGETKHLIEHGLNPEDVCKALNRTPSAIAKLAAKRNETEIARIFYQLKTQQQKG
jgi:hypothetical protein